MSNKEKESSAKQQTISISDGRQKYTLVYFELKMEDKLFVKRQEWF